MCYQEGYGGKPGLPARWEALFPTNRMVLPMRKTFRGNGMLMVCDSLLFRSRSMLDYSGCASRSFVDSRCIDEEQCRIRRN
jgi:hypothetical protein